MNEQCTDHRPDLLFKYLYVWNYFDYLLFDLLIYDPDGNSISNSLTFHVDFSDG